MKYTSTNKPLVCMQTQSTCYKGTSTMTIKGVLWHSTGANNPNLKRYVQPSDTKPAADTYSATKWLEVLGKNTNKNDWNHIEVKAGLNGWIGKQADGTITAIQTMPWNYRPWGCGSGSNGSCNSGWIQFEICEDSLTDKNYFNKVYTEACELTAYLCRLYKIDPKGTVTFEGVKVPTILCHADSYKLGLGSNHGDVLHWFKKHGKTMDDVRNDVAKLLSNTASSSEKVQESTVQKLYRIRLSWSDVKSQKGAFASLENAKECCQKAGAGYKVFDWEGKEVYAYSSSTQVENNTKKAVYELDFPQKHLIIDNISDLLDKKACTKAIVAITKNNSNFNAAIAKAFFSLAGKYRIDPMRAISQSILETGWFKFVGSSVKAEQNNYCGLGAVGNGAAGASFATVEDGVRAQLQHLYAYGCKDAVPSGEPIVDPRFKYVTRGIAPYWEQLAGRWAIPGFAGSDPAASVAAGTTYGQKIDKIYNGLIVTAITEADIKKYFKEDLENAPVESAPNVVIPENVVTPSEPEMEPITPDIKEDTEEKIDISKVNFILGLLEKVLLAIIEFFKKKQ